MSDDSFMSSKLSIKLADLPHEIKDINAKNNDKWKLNKSKMGIRWKYKWEK